jgi:hypothetical protein
LKWPASVRRANSFAARSSSAGPRRDSGSS